MPSTFISIALILLDTDRKNEGQLQPEDFGQFATDSSIGIDYVKHISAQDQHARSAFGFRSPSKIQSYMLQKKCQLVDD